jgi:hypothetical protein
MGALRVLEALEGEEDQTAYTVNLSNPVCPCCGAKLIIQDDTEPGQNEELNTDMVDEQFADPDVILPLVREAASDIVEGYVAYARESMLDDRQIANSLCYPQDPELKDAIQRKSKELKSIFSSAYGLLVNEQIIVQDLRDAIKRIVTGGRRS